MNVTRINYDQLPESEKGNQPENGCGAEYANYLRVEFSEDDVEFFSDAMEPEDARFSRALSWIKGALLKAYAYGKEEK